MYKMARTTKPNNLQFVGKLPTKLITMSNNYSNLIFWDDSISFSFLFSFKLIFCRVRESLAHTYLIEKKTLSLPYINNESFFYNKKKQGQKLKEYIGIHSEK